MATADIVRSVGSWEKLPRGDERLGLKQRKDEQRERSWRRWKSRGVLSFLPPPSSFLPILSWHEYCQGAESHEEAKNQTKSTKTEKRNKSFFKSSVIQLKRPSISLHIHFPVDASFLSFSPLLSLGDVFESGHRKYRGYRSFHLPGLLSMMTEINKLKRPEERR